MESNESNELDKLKITIVEARNLTAHKQGSLDAYAKVKYNNKKYRTPVISNTDHPIWNEGSACFLFDLEDSDESDPTISITCVSHHILHKEDFLGTVSIPLSTFAETKIVDSWFPLQPSKKHTEPVTGEIHIILEYVMSDEGGSGKFFKRFPAVPNTEKLLNDYRCALTSKGMLMQGHMYISEHYVCFYSNLLVKKKKLMLKVDKIMGITKKKNGVKVPNAIEIITAEKTYHFESFLHRDQVYDQLFSVWEPTQDPETIKKHKRSVSTDTNASHLAKELLNTIASGVSIHGPNQSQEVLLQIDVQDYSQLKCEKAIKVSTTLDKTVQSVLNKLGEHGFPQNELSNYSLYLPFGSTFSASMTRKKTVLDPLQTLNFYNLENNSVLLLKKKKESGGNESINVSVEIGCFEELKCNKTISLVVHGSDSIYNVLQKIVIEGNVNIPSEKIQGYTLFVSKSKERGITVEDPQTTVSALDIQNKNVLYLVKKMPITTFYQKFDIREDKSYEEICFEVCANCILSPMFGFPEYINEQDKQRLLKHLCDFLGVAKQQPDVIQRIKTLNTFGKENWMLELVHRLELLDSHPWYNVDSFGAEQFKKWRTSEYDIIKNTMLDFVFDKNFVGILSVKVKEANNLAPQNKNGTADTYLVLSIDENKQKTKTQKKQLHPEFNQDFQFELTNPTDKVLNISLMSKAEIIGQTDVEIGDVKIPLSDLLYSTKQDRWFPFEGTSGKIHLQLEFLYSLSKYISLLKDSNTKVDLYALNPALDAKVNHNWFYKSLLKAFMFHISDNNPRAENEILSPPASWVIDEFAQRLGVRRPFRNVLFLKYVDRIFKPVPSQIDHIHNTLDAVLKDSALTTRGKAIYAKATQDLVVTISGFIQTYRRVFPKNMPQGALDACIDTLRLFERAKALVLAEKISTILKATVKSNYDKMRDVTLSGTVDVLSDQSIIALCDKIQNDVAEDIPFKSSFDGAGINFLETIATNYYLLFTADVKKFCEKTQYTSPSVFDVFLKLRTFETHPSFSFIVSGQKPIAMELEDLFSPFIFGWFKQLKLSLCKTIADTYEHDKCMHIRPDTMETLHSHSVVEMFEELKKSTQFVQNHLKLQKPFYHLQYAEIVTQAATEYLELVYARAKELSQNKSKESNFSIPLELYVCLNNAEFGRARVLTLYEQSKQAFANNTLEKQVLKDSIKLCYDTVLNQNKKNFDIVLDTITPKIVSQLMAHLHTAIAAVTPQATAVDLKPAISYISSIVEIFLKYLFDNLTKEFLLKIWLGMVVELKKVLLSSEKTASRFQAKAIDSIIEQFTPIFYASRKGITNASMEESTFFIHSLVQLWQKSSHQLIDAYLHTIMEFSKSPMEVVGRDHVLLILRSRTLHDLEAKAFCAELELFEKHPEKVKEYQQLRNHFAMPDTEQILLRQHCTHSEKKKVGEFLVTSNGIHWDTTISQKTPDLISIRLRELTEVKKIKLTLIFDALQLSTAETKVVFSKFDDREAAFKEIYDQAIFLGNSSFKTE